MNEFFRTHRKTRWAFIGTSTLALIVILLIIFFDWNLLRPTLARAIAAHTGRQTFIDGDLKVHIWSWNPSAEINGLRMMNPNWADRDLMFGAKKIAISISLRHLLQGQFVLPQIDLVEPSVNLERDAKGRASWELGTQQGQPNHNTQPTKLPTIRSLTVEDGKLHIVDQVRKLIFNGTLVAAQHKEDENNSAFKIQSAGSLNAKPFRLDANGGALLDLDPHKPYSFFAHLTASDIDLQTHITVLEPFDLGKLDVKFIVSGNDLADIFYLTGLALPNTPHYRVAATVHVNGTQITIDNLKGHLGTSDLEGQVHIQTAGERPKLSATLSSVTLNIADLAPTLGQPAPKVTSLSTAANVPNNKAAKASEPGKFPAKNSDVNEPNDGKLLPDADLQITRVRGMDADVNYKAVSVVAPKVPMKAVVFHLVLDNGLLKIDPLSFVLDQGKFQGRVQIDARNNIPLSDIDMRIDNIDLSQFKSATMKQPPLQGVMQGRFKFHGSGSSIHKFAANSDGAISIAIPHGQVSDVIAELTGINVLRGLGLLLSKDQTPTDIRCGIIDFKDQQGNLNTTTVYVDTSNVLITGRGNINLDSENLNLALQGDPKKLRLLRLRSPITLHGTLLHPAVGVKADKLAEQAGIATALGALLTPVAAAIAFIDPGLAKNKDCLTVLQQANAGIQN